MYELNMVMVDMDMIRTFIHTLFQGKSGRTISKKAILIRVKNSDIAGALRFFHQLAGKTDYSEHALLKELEDIAVKENATGAVFGKIR
jgi:hypothetical protein